jgi:outer membrane protein assembly factor BamB
MIARRHAFKICVCFLAFACTATAQEQQARRILDAAGVKGGLMVHLGCGDGKLTAALHTSDRLLVCGLDADANNVAAARKYIDSLGLYGKVTAEQYDGKDLPYGDNMVNLIVVDAGAAPSPGEIERVLVPKGKLVVRSGLTLECKGLERVGEFGGWTQYVKPWPADIDQWTHFLHDASGNAVSKDKRVRNPRHTQWHAEPRFARDHDSLASLSAMTSSDGRLFYIYDEGTVSIIHRPPHWKLIARDAFNGKLLWKRDIPTWMTHLYNFRAGPAQIPRRLVSVGERVYTTLGWDAPVVKLDAATGRTLHTYAGTKGAEEIVFHNGTLLVATGNTDRHIKYSDRCIGYWQRVDTDVPTPRIAIIACDAASGRQLWKIDGGDIGHLMPLSLCALGKGVFYLDDKQLHCLDAATGKQRWASPFQPPAEGIYMRDYAPTVVAYRDVVLVLTWKSLVAYAIDNGRRLWKQKGAIGFASPGDLFAIGQDIWTFPMLKGVVMPPRSDLINNGQTADGIHRSQYWLTIPRSDFINNGQTGVGIDIHSGKIVEEMPFQRTQHHHRCYRDKATEDYFLIGHSGIQVVNRRTKQSVTHRWVRGECGYGIMPANGYIYVPPDGCQCYFDAKINGFFALSDKNSWDAVNVVSALRKGPAYGTIENIKSKIENQSDWPTYRADPARSGSVATNLSREPMRRWDVAVGETLTAPVVAAGRVYLADKDACTVYCLDAASGKTRWKFFADGPVDSPPTISASRCTFGSFDGSVYCLDAETGNLAWRFKTSKIERRIGWDNRLASPLLIHGSVLVLDNTVYFAAGYSSNLDGGIRLYGLDLQTAKLLHFTKIASGHWGNDGQYGYLSDVLTCDGGTIGMRVLGFDKTLNRKSRPALQTHTSFLDSSWFHREQWRYRQNQGKLIVFNDNGSVSVDNIYTGLKQRRKVTNTDQTGSKWNQVGHLHQKYTRYLKEDWFPVGTDLVSKGHRNWRTHEDLQPRAMALAGDKLCVAGWIDGVAIELKTGLAKDPTNPDPHAAVLQILSGNDGKRTFECRLPSEPVFDGLAAADGGFYITCKNGHVLCFR